MNLKILFLIFLIINQCCANDRVKKICEKLEKIDTRRSKNIPLHLRDLGPFTIQVEESEYIDKKFLYPKLTRHHVIPGNILLEVFKKLAEQRSNSLLRILTSIYNNLPDNWKNTYTAAIECINFDKSDDELRSTYNEVDIDVFCKGKIEDLIELFYWRSDNIQIGPTARFRDFRKNYDYDCLYLLRDDELAHNIAFKQIIYEIFSTNIISDDQNALLLRINENMVCNRNTPRSYYADEWIQYDENDPDPRVKPDYHSKYYLANLTNIRMSYLEKILEMSEDERRGVQRLDKRIESEAIERIKNYISSQYTKYTKKRTKRIISKIIKEKNPVKIGNLASRFFQRIGEPAEPRMFFDILSLKFNGNAFLIMEFIHVYNLKSSEKINIDLELIKIKKIFKKLQVSFGSKSGNYYIDLATLTEARDFLREYLRKMNQKFPSGLLDTALKLISDNDFVNDNITMDVKRFIETRRRDNDDDDDREKEYYNKNLSIFFILFYYLNNIFNSYGYMSSIKSAYTDLTSATSRPLLKFLNTPLEETCESITKDVKGDRSLLEWHERFTYLYLADFDNVTIQRYRNRAFGVGVSVLDVDDTEDNIFDENSKTSWYRNVAAVR